MLVRLAIAFGLTVALAAPVRAAEPILLADTERNFRRSMAKISRALGPEKTADLERALLGLVSIRSARDRLEESKGFADRRPDWILGRMFSRGPEKTNQDLAGIVTMWIGRRIDGRTPSEILILLQRERDGLDGAVAEMAGRLRHWESPLMERQPRPRVHAEAMPAGKLIVTSISGSVQNTSRAGRGVISFLVENKHHRAIRAVVLAPSGDETTHCASFEYTPALPLRAGATQRIIASATPEQANCANQFQPVGFRDDANQHFGAVVNQSVVDGVSQLGWFYRTTAFAESFQAVALQNCH